MAKKRKPRHPREKWPEERACSEELGKQQIPPEPTSQWLLHSKHWSGTLRENLGVGGYKGKTNWNILHNQEEHNLFQEYCQLNLISSRTRTQSYRGLSSPTPTRHIPTRQFHASRHRFQGGILETDIKGVGAGSPEQVMLSEGGQEPHEKQGIHRAFYYYYYFLKSSAMSLVLVLV